MQATQIELNNLLVDWAHYIYFKDPHPYYDLTEDECEVLVQDLCNNMNVLFEKDMRENYDIDGYNFLDWFNFKGIELDQFRAISPELIAYAVSYYDNVGLSYNWNIVLDFGEERPKERLSMLEVLLVNYAYAFYHENLDLLPKSLKFEQGLDETWTRIDPDM